MHLVRCYMCDDPVCWVFASRRVYRISCHDVFETHCEACGDIADLDSLDFFL